MDGKRIPVPIEIEPDPDALKAPLVVNGTPETEDEVRLRVEAAYATRLPWSHLAEAWQQQSGDAAHGQGPHDGISEALP